MTRYRKTMAQAMNEGAIEMQIATLKKAYEPMRNKRISLDNANKLSQIFNKFDSNKEMLKQLYKADIPFVSAMASSRLIGKHSMKAQELMQIRKEGIETATEELQQINEIFLGEGVGHISGFKNDKEKANMISLAKQHGLKVDDSGPKLKLSGNMRKILDMQLAAQKNGLKAEEVRISLDESKMKTIATMFADGKSAQEIAQKMKLSVDTVKAILGEVKEGTMIGGIVTDNSGKKMPGYDKAKKALKDFMSKPQPAKGASDKVMSFIFDDELLDDLYSAEKKNMSDVRPMVKKRLKALGIKEDLEEENIYEFKKMTVTIADPMKRNKAMQDIEKQGFKIQRLGSRGFKVDGNGADLNKYATDLKNFYGADVRAESYTIDESADEDFYNPVTEACWVGYKQVGMKNKGGKQVPNCVPESVQEEVDENAPSAADIDRLKKQGMKPKKEQEEEKSDDKEKLKAEIEKKDAEIQSLKVKAETDKAKVAKKETEKMVNPETGEPLLQVGVAYKYMRDKMSKMKEDADYLKPRMNKQQLANIKNVWKNKTKKDVTPAVKSMIKNMDVPTQLAIKDAGINLLSDLVEVTKDGAYAIGMAAAKKKYNDEPPLDKKTITKGHEIAKSILKKEEAHPAKEMYEQIAGLKKKAEKSGMPYSILKKVYDRGMAAWRGGHRPGATQQQWAFARVNSFVTKSSGTWGGADKDLAKQVRGSK